MTSSGDQPICGAPLADGGVCTLAPHAPSAHPHGHHLNNPLVNYVEQLLGWAKTARVHDINAENGSSYVLDAEKCDAIPGQVSTFVAVLLDRKVGLDAEISRAVENTIAAHRRQMKILGEQIRKVLDLHMADPHDPSICIHCGTPFPCLTARFLMGDS